MNYQEKQDLDRLKCMMNGDNIQINHFDTDITKVDVFKVNWCYIVFNVSQQDGESTFFGAYERDDLDILLIECKGN